MVTRESLAGLARQMRALEDARRQAATGLRVSRPSDDPVAVAGILQSDSGLRALEQYQRNLASGQARLQLEDSVLSEMSQALERAREVGIGQAGDTANAQTRATSAAEITHLAELMKGLANSQLAGAYVFGGQYADRAPYQNGLLDPAHPPSGALRVESGVRESLETNHSAQEIFVDSDAVAALQSLSDALGANDVTGVRAALTRIDTAFDAVQALTGDLGARANQLDISLTNLEALEVNLRTFRSSLQDADMTEAVTHLVERQTSLEAAMLANSRILNLTLTDYLR
jgi:flagellar hook-associated protein 3 FlgL